MTAPRGELPREPPTQPYYPNFADANDAARRRWDLCVAIAPRVLGEDSSSGELWMFAGMLFRDPERYPTD
ncbi:MAG: hypothetical protein WKF96_16415 [Solirubrobacteraceae bacterium]